MSPIPATQTTRRPDWPEQLTQVLARWRHRPFSWGKADCAHFACDVLSHVTVQDWSSIAFPPYTSATTASNALEQSGFMSLPDAVTQLLGSPVPVVMAQRGDLLAIQTKSLSRFHQALGVCTGAHAFALGQKGLVACPISHALYCWRI